MEKELLSIREFARRDGCSYEWVRKAIKQGMLEAEPDGTIRAELVGTNWRKRNSRRVALTRAARDNPPEDTDAELEERAATLVSSGEFELLDYSEAEKLKENYQARLKQLDYETKAGLVVPASEVVRVVGEEYARVRTRLMAIPAEQAPRLHLLKTVPEIQDALEGIITEALEALSRDAA